MAQVTAKTPEQKRALFQNKITLERLVCDNIYSKREFEGATWLSVRKENEERKFLIREDALTRIS
jgi:hypothetical protein